MLALSIDMQTDTHLTASFSGQPGYAGTRKIKPVSVLMKQKMVGWHWLQTDNHDSTSSLNFYRPDALPDAQPTVAAFFCRPDLLFCHSANSVSGNEGVRLLLRIQSSETHWNLP